MRSGEPRTRVLGRTQPQVGQLLPSTTPATVVSKAVPLLSEVGPINRTTETGECALALQRVFKHFASPKIVHRRSEVGHVLPALTAVVEEVHPVALLRIDCVLLANRVRVCRHGRDDLTCLGVAQFIKVNWQRSAGRLFAMELGK